MTSSQRPRPRARKVTSTLVSPTEDVHSTLSPPPLSAGVALTGDDEDFFTRKKAVKGGRVDSAPMLDLDLADSEDESDIAENNVGSSSDVEGHRRKKPRRQVSSWTKSASFNKVDSMPSLASLSQDEDEDDDDDNHVTSHDTKASRRKAVSRSPSLTPPPALDPQVIQRLRSVLDQYTTSKPADALDEDESFTADIEGKPDLDPDLVRMIRGDRAREQRKLAKESEARQRQEEDRMKRYQPMQKAAVPEVDAIEVDDSDEESPRKYSQRDQTSSSPVQMVSFSQKTRQEASAKSPAPVKRPSPKAVVEEEEEEERLAITMKGGEGGKLQADVRVKPTTALKRLLDHFKEKHKDAIPPAKLKSVRIRFDGDWLDPSTTVADAGIEDEEQIDVVW